jgi:hypothetical protein
MNVAQRLLIAGLRLYRVTISPLLAALIGPGAGCRFQPTCSVYAIEAVQRHGACRGAWLALRRLGRCQPWGGCGHDPVPPPRPPTPPPALPLRAAPRAP